MTKQCDKCNGTGRVIDQVEFGNSMRQMREKREVSLSNVAIAMGFSKAYISDLELGRRGWNMTLIQAFKEACGFVPKLKKSAPIKTLSDAMKRIKTNGTK